MIRKAALVTALLSPVACVNDTPVPTDTSLAEVAEPLTAQVGSEGLTRKDIPSEDPGPPLYARVTSIQNQFFHTDGWLAIPFYRSPSCVPSDFNLLELFDFPGPGGPGAFACPLLAQGFLLTEADAPLGTFPRQVVLTGDAVPFWFVRWSDFQAEAGDGVVTLAELQALDPMTGVATRYHETLKPREGAHEVVIDGAGPLDDGRQFRFHVTHLEDQTRSIQVRFR